MAWVSPSRRQHGGWRVRLVVDDDGDDLLRRDRDRRAADAVVDAGQRDRRAGRPVGRDIDVVQAFQVGAVGQVDLDDDLLGEDREARRVAHRGGWHDVALLGDRGGFDDGDVRQLQLVVAQLLDGFREVLVDEHHFAGVDRLAQGAVDLERHAPGEHAGLGELLVEVVAEAGAGHQADTQRTFLGAHGQRLGYGLGLAGAGETAHADGHAVLDQVGGFGRTHHLVEQGGQAHAITVHGTNLRRRIIRGRQSRVSAIFRLYTKVEALFSGLMGGLPGPPRPLSPGLRRAIGAGPGVRRGGPRRAVPPAPR